MSAGLKQQQAEASFVPASISPLYEQIKELKMLLYGLYAASFLLLLFSARRDNIIGSLLQAAAKTIFHIDIA